MKLMLAFTFCFFFVLQLILAQTPTQTIRGRVYDASSLKPVAYANVIIQGINPILGAVSDSDGTFAIPSVPVGRYDIKTTFVGYEPYILKEIIITSGKQTNLTIPLRQISGMLKEVVIRSTISKDQPLNPMALASARMLSVDEASRYAGGFDDPARLVSSFAGVASNVASNGIVVRGNAPKALQWKLEGVEIPNPNHFADLAVFGGGGLTALSTKMLANSDFLASAFPAEYGNALSGVFDIQMRNGNNNQNEYSAQIGVIGVEFSSEGPFIKGKPSSYIFNYRYSTLGLLKPLLPENGEGVTYQDWAFKTSFQTRKAGVFSVWGIGLVDKSGANAKTDTLERIYRYDMEEQKVWQFMAAGGITHKYWFGKNTLLKTTLAATGNGIRYKTGLLDTNGNIYPENYINNNITHFILSTSVNSRPSAKHNNISGFTLTLMSYYLLLKNSFQAQQAPVIIVDQSGQSSLASFFSQSSFKLTGNITFNAGIHVQYFVLNGHIAPEPRIGIRWGNGKNHSIAFSYGLHSRLEAIPYYFTSNTADGHLYNKNLGFAKAHHWVLAYDISPRENMHFKVEPYFQYLFNIPVIEDSSFSFINMQADWFFNEKLVNRGQGLNYGIDITIEKYLHKGFYYMCTLSLFDSRYQGGDQLWRNTRYNRLFLFNILGGKEWKTGKNKQNIFAINLRASYQGGDRYSPVDLYASQAKNDIVFNENNAYSLQFPASLTIHSTISYTMNRKKSTHEVALKIINATNFKEYLGFRYNLKTGQSDLYREAIMIPNLSYRIDF